MARVYCHHHHGQSRGLCAECESLVAYAGTLSGAKTLTTVTLTPVEGAPRNFMGDALKGDNLDYVLRLYGEYYHKATVTVAGQGE